MEQRKNFTKKVFGFNSIPGLSIGTSLTSFKDYLNKEFSVSSRVVSIDKKLREIFYKDSSTPILNETDDFWFRLLSLPPRKIKELWEKASESAFEEVNVAKEEFIFVFFHSSFFSYDYKWRVSGVDINQLKKFKFLAFFNFIDDIYDIHFRGRDRRAILRRREVTQEENDEQRFLNFIELTIFKLVEYIDWRQSEILLTDIFALHLGVPSFIFSNKHPKQTLWKLIRNLEGSAYLSHPISEVRRSTEKDTDTSFFEYEKFENSELYSQIARIANHVRQQFPLIEPTTIDELRIKKIRIKPKTKDEKLLLSTFLSPRWTISSLVSLAPELPHNRQIFNSILVPYDVEFLGLTNILEKFTDLKLNDSIYLQVHYLMSILDRKIKQDIAWRDHHLVEQTNNLLVLRPTFLGKSSGGVRREVQYFINADRLKAKCLILHEEGDCHQCSQKSASSILESVKKLRDYQVNFLNPQINLVIEQIENQITNQLTNYINIPLITIQDLITDVTKIIYQSLHRASETQFDVGILDPDPFQEISEEDQQAFNNLSKHITKSLLKGNFYIEVLKKEGNKAIKFTDNEESFLNVVSESNFFKIAKEE
jgi:hypothetical protein